MSYLYDVDYAGLTQGHKYDNRAALQAAWNDATSKGKGLWITKDWGMGLDANGVGLRAPTNGQLKFTDSGSLKLIQHSRPDYQMILLDSVSGVWIENARLDGSMEQNLYSGGEHGMGISILNSSNCAIMDAKIQDTWGDGIYIGGDGTPNSNIEIWNPDIQGCRRNGISIISADGLKIWRPVTRNIKGTNPKCGIDFEPNNNSNKLSNIQIYSPMTIGNNLGIEFAPSGLAYLEAGMTAQPIVCSVDIYDWTDVNSRDTALNRYDFDHTGFTVASGSHFRINTIKYVKSNILKDITSPYDNSIVWTLVNEVSIT